MKIIIYLVKNLKLILWRLPKASKNPEKFWQQWVTNSPFERAPYHRHTNQIRVGGRILGCCSQKVVHNRQGEEANRVVTDPSSRVTNEVKMCTLINKVNNISLRYPQGFKMERVHPLVKALFPIYSVPVGPLAGRLSLFYSNWTKLTQDPNILNIMQGFEIPFLEKPYQAKLPNPPVLNHKQSSLVRQKAKEMLLKGAIQKVTQCRIP